MSGRYLVYLLTLFSTFFQFQSPIKPELDLVGPLVKESREMTISLVGDILMDGSVRAQIDKNGIDYPWEHVKGYFQEDDLTIANLETSITRGGSIWPDKQFNFRSDPANLKALKEAGLEVVSLANNHSLDYGYDGFLDTINYLDQYKIGRVGGGKNKKEALRGEIIELDHMRIGILGFSRVIPTVEWYATDKRPGLVGAYDPHIEEVVKRVKEMKEEVDLLIVSIHWGVELSEYPREAEVKLGRSLIDQGVDIVMGHHPHVLQGMEIYKGKPIIYSLGNFIFGGKSDLTRNTMISQIILQDGVMDRIKVIPCQIINGRPIPLEGEDRLGKIQYLRNISKNFNTSISDEGIIKIK